LELLPRLKARRGFQSLGPYPVNAASLNNLLIFARATARRPLTAHYLAEVFGPQASIAHQMVSELYSSVMRTQRKTASSRIKTFFNEWDRIFGVVYGEELGKAEKSAEDTAKAYNLPGGVRLKQLLFAIHTYYALIMKLIAIELLSLQENKPNISFVSDLSAQDDDKLLDSLRYLESGLGYIERGISNFLEADFFSWYLDAWNPKLAELIRRMVQALSQFEPATPILEPDWTRDLLQKLYENILPKNLRHSLGEYYTPNWLAGYLIDKSGYSGDSTKRFLDPACGSGTFLVRAINKVIEFEQEKENVYAKEVANNILNNIVGFDLNPLAVLSARTNYLIAFSRFIPFVRPISLPIFLCDSVCAPSEYVDDEGGLPFNDVVVFTTTEKDYAFPISILSKDGIDLFTAMAYREIGNNTSCDIFKTMLEKAFHLPSNDIGDLLRIYSDIKQLEEEGKNGIWARYLKNAFAPKYMGKFDYVIGNPPWIRWSYLSTEYRKRTLSLWRKYGLFSLKGHQARLGPGEKDFSMLFVYSSADNYLKDDGILAFVITLEVFKSKGAGEGFRRFKIGEKGDDLKIALVEDMVDLKPFEAAANKTSIFVLQKGAKIKYPVRFVEWKRKKGIGRIKSEWSIEEVLKKTTRKNLQAVPIDQEKLCSSWQTMSVSDERRLLSLKGGNPYLARLGARVEPYGVFWLSIEEVRPAGLLTIKNRPEKGKRKIKKVTAAVEPELIYPAITGGDITKFGIKSNIFTLISQNPETREPYLEDWMIENAPLTLGYLSQFKDILLSRGSRVVRELAEKTAFYAMFGIGEYTFSKYKVVWKRMASRLEAVVLSNIQTPFGRKRAISTDTTSIFSLDNKDEAHYLCAILNSELVDSYIRSFSSAGRGFGSPSVMENLAIPKFVSENEIHFKLSDLSQHAHKLVKAGKSIDKIEKEIESQVERLWNIKN